MLSNFVHDFILTAVVQEEGNSTTQYIGSLLRVRFLTNLTKK
jgi:hypothetical protein